MWDKYSIPNYFRREYLKFQGFTVVHRVWSWRNSDSRRGLQFSYWFHCSSGSDPLKWMPEWSEGKNKCLIARPKPGKMLNWAWCILVWMVCKCPLGTLDSHDLFQEHERLYHLCHLFSFRRQESWSRSWSRELSDFLKCTLTLRMFLPVSQMFSRSHECLSSLVFSRDVSMPVFSL